MCLWAKWQVREGVLVIGETLSRNGLYVYATVTNCEFVKVLNAFAPNIFFSLYVNVQVPFVESIFAHGPNPLLLNLSKHYPIRFILSSEYYVSFLYEANTNSSYKQVLSITGLHALQLCTCLRDLSLCQNWILLSSSCRYYPDNSNVSICAIQMISNKEWSEMACFIFCL